MSTPTPQASSVSVYKAHMEFSDKHPQWMDMAVQTISRWGRHEVTLQQAIGEALMKAHELGTRGESPGQPANTATGTTVLRVKRRTK